MEKMGNLMVSYGRTLIDHGKIGLLFAIAGEIFTKLLGGWDSMLTTLFMFMAFDYISGWIIALMGKSKKSANGKLNSTAGWYGLAKKGITIIVVLMACRLDLTAEQLGIDMIVNIRTIVIGFYIGIEGISILENYELIAGERIPAPLKKALESLIGKSEE